MPLEYRCPLDAFNLGIVKPDSEDPHGAIARIESYFTSRDLPYRIQLRDDQVETLEPKLREQGYAEVLPTPAMVLKKIPAAPSLPEELQIEIVKGETALKAYRKIIEEGYGMPKGMRVAAISDRIVNHPDTALFIGHIDGAPAATSLLIMTNQVAGIYMVATAEAYRRRGLGAAITWASVTEGRRRGTAFASLQASAMGRPVYERMGVETISTYHPYASPGSDPEAGFAS